jgi:hypothetical protein
MTDKTSHSCCNKSATQENEPSGNREKLLRGKTGCAKRNSHRLERPRMWYVC